MTTGIDVRTRDCYVLEDAKNRVLELMTITNNIDSDYIQTLLTQLYSELDYRHELLKSPHLSQLATEQQGDISKG